MIVGVLMLFATSPVSAAPIDTMDKEISSIQSVMNKVNVELGATYYIPEGNEEKVLSSLEGMSLVEIEDYLVNQYLEIPSDDRLQEETIRQIHPLP